MSDTATTATKGRMIMARTWEQVKKEAVAEGRIDPARVERLKREMLDVTRAYRLAEIRKHAGETQESLAKILDVSQGRISQLENGEIARTEVGTLAAYVAALGGRLEMVADFGEFKLTVGG